MSDGVAALCKLKRRGTEAAVEIDEFIAALETGEELGRGFKKK